MSKLAELSEAGGCGGKLPAESLERLLMAYSGESSDVIVGIKERDDAAVLSSPGSEYLVSTIDFFSPIVHDPFLFGQISAANSLSDVYAMGGVPCHALSILGYPEDQCELSEIKKILQGAESICLDANVTIVGGHSIINPQPIFGLSVIGSLTRLGLKTTRGANCGDLIFLTKPIGTGVLSNAIRSSSATKGDELKAISSMKKLNRIGAALASIQGVSSMTDVSGFGLVGHLTEICISSNASAKLDTSKVSLICDLGKYFNAGFCTNGGKRNLAHYRKTTRFPNRLMEEALTDPQTSGGLLFTVAPDSEKAINELYSEYDIECCLEPIGQIGRKRDDGVVIECQ